jgi:hypothetical protein
MNRIVHSDNVRLYLNLIALVALAAIWRAGEAINMRLAELPVKEAPRVDRNNTTLDAKSFYPVWVKQAVAMPRPDDGAEMDALFTRKIDKPEEPKLEPIKSVEPDYGEWFKQVARVDGVSDDGVFVNGRFYKLGDKMQDLSFTTASGKPVTPVVESIKKGRVTFRIGKSTVVFLFGG